MNWWYEKSSAEGFLASRDRPPSITEVCRQLLIGEYPRCEDFAWLKGGFGVTTVQSLQDDEDLRAIGLKAESLRRACELEGLKFVRTPIADGGAAAMAAGLDAALKVLIPL